MYRLARQTAIIDYGISRQGSLAGGSGQNPSQNIFSDQADSTSFFVIETSSLQLIFLTCYIDLGYLGL
jgi:hypothetical protein